MKLTFLGAAHEVTGSCTLVEAAGHRFLVDCGMEQGRNTYENEDLPCAPGEIEAVLLTHAHIDHSGRLPYLYKNGYRGPIYATDATTDLCDIMLEDSAHIQEQEAEWKNRKAQRSGREPVEPDYTVQDALAVMEQFRPQPYGKPVAVLPGVQATFTDVGHLLGSSSITLRITEEGRTETIVFSGDIGNSNQPMLRDPQYLTEADYVVMESTYGNRSHGPKPDYVGELAAVLQRTFDRGGNVVIPSFAVGRTQEMLYFIRQIKAENRVRGHGNFEVYVDSPLASKSTTIFRENYSECFDQEALDLVRSGQNPLSFPGLRISETKEDSVAINADPSPKVILSASGMCDAGRIRHHLKHNLWREECTILFVGYQAAGSLGRTLLEGADQVKLFGEEVQVNAEIAQMSGMSGHADHDGLLRWLHSFAPKPGYVFVNHGDDEVCAGFAKELEGEGYAAEAPYPGGSYLLAGGAVRCLDRGNTEKIAHREPEPAAADYKTRRASQAFERLVNMGRRLMVVIEHNRGGANKDLARFASQIASLCDKWDR
ncbi:MBL fold metallo-hydrolase RNA specificity domain-containing protein [uncultured Subdoligranulum sp.]|uniref:MBL fold metallo-hydrolase RNA specificity domain-containing protein n=1 Tax=uncultured Subdoligranulum sp. TaxID=512298 RepID=UPI0025FF41F8|nr:MBL fold metallo-hydrolase [uncultured Subdoligranulum sp.]